MNKKSGPKPKLQPTEETLKTVKGLGLIQATSKECAAVLGVTEPTWIKFKADNPEVEEALRHGQGEGLTSLRRQQFQTAMKGNPTMLIWLGKQYLGQTDKQDITANVTQDVTVSDARSKLEHLISRHADSGVEGGPSRKPN